MILDADSAIVLPAAKPSQTSAISWRCTTTNLSREFTTMQQHILYSLLSPPSTASQNYDRRPCRHDRQLPGHAGHLMDCDFVTCALYKDAY